ncbi:hypothetical protein ACHAXT_000387 [Thalassiosira profunda]
MMETDGLLTVPGGAASGGGGSRGGGSDGGNNGGCSRWALVAAVCLAALAADVAVRIGGASNGAVDTSSASVAASVADTVPAASRKGRYHATQFISFTINTLGGLAEFGECEGRSVDPASGSCYLGDDDIESDVNHRLAIFEEVLYILRNDVFQEEPEIDRDPGVLKILALPEFFLRGPNGAYSTKALFDSEIDEEDGLLIQLAEKVRELIFDEAFEDYLFVLGTVIAAESMNPDDYQKKPWEKELSDAHDVMYFNFAPVYRGGPDHKGTKQHIVMKQYISGADFLSRSKLPNPSDFDVHKYAKADKSKILAETFEKRNLTVVTDNYLQFDGIKVGIEICLDHRMGALWNNLRTKHNSDLVDVQLITSAGMSIERGPNPLKPGGVVYLSDGEASSAACVRTDSEAVFDPNHVCRGKPGGIQHRPHGGPGYTSFVGLSGCIDMERSKLLAGYYSAHQPQGCANTLRTYGIDVMDKFKHYPPSLEVYPTIELPE